MNANQLPVACTLSDSELRQRESTLVKDFKSGVLSVTELADGYSFRLQGDEKWIAIATGLIAAERECCPFLTFQLIAEPNRGGLVVNFTGPKGTKEFLQAVFPSESPKIPG